MRLHIYNLSDRQKASMLDFNAYSVVPEGFHLSRWTVQTDKGQSGRLKLPFSTFIYFVYVVDA